MTTIRHPTAGAALVAALALLSAYGGVAAAQQRDLKPLVGAYVGRAEEIDLSSRQRELRDIDIVISATDEGGITIDWTNVTLVDGRRDVPGVKRRHDAVSLAPVEGKGYYLAGPGYDPFRGESKPDPLGGKPLRWATLEAGVQRN